MPITKELLSASTGGRGILIANTTSPGTTVHVGNTNTSIEEEVWLYVSNPDVAGRVITVQWGGTTSPNDNIVSYVGTQQGLQLIAPGLLLRGNSPALEIKVFADSANKVVIYGYVNRIS